LGHSSPSPLCCATVGTARARRRHETPPSHCSQSPCHRHAKLVSPRSHLAVRELSASPRWPRHRANSRCSDHAGGARPLRRRHGPAGRFGNWAGPVWLGRGPIPAHHCSLISISFLSYFFFRNSYKLLKFKVNEIKLRKIWNKFL
jgi:hypothetical protein